MNGVKCKSIDQQLEKSSVGFAPSSFISIYFTPNKTDSYQYGDLIIVDWLCKMHQCSILNASNRLALGSHVGGVTLEWIRFKLTCIGIKAIVWIEWLIRENRINTLGHKSVLYVLFLIHLYCFQAIIFNLPLSMAVGWSNQIQFIWACRSHMCVLHGHVTCES